MAIDNFCEGKNMEEYEVLKKAAAELNEIMHAAHINASDRAVYEYLTTNMIFYMMSMKD